MDRSRLILFEESPLDMMTNLPSPPFMAVIPSVIVSPTILLTITLASSVGCEYATISLLTESSTPATLTVSSLVARLVSVESMVRLITSSAVTSCCDSYNVKVILAYGASHDANKTLEHTSAIIIKMRNIFFIFFLIRILPHLINYII